MHAKVNYALVGFFVLLLGGTFIALTLWITASTDKKQYTHFIAHMSESVSGLNLQAAVKYRGVAVGEVREISLDRDNPERVRLVLAIEHDAPIKTDTVATLATQGITGLAYIELTGGTMDAPLLTVSQEGVYPEIQTGPSLFVRLDAAVSGVLTQLQDLVLHLRTVAGRVNRLLNDKNQASIAQVLNNLQSLTERLDQHMVKMGPDWEKTFANTAQASEQLPQLIEQLATSSKELKRTFKTINNAADTVDDVMDETKRGIKQVSRDTLNQVETLFSEMQLLIESLSRVSADVERDPNILLFGNQRKRKPGPGEKN